MWVDSVELTVQSGRGGDGLVCFRREKGVEWGGPNGGDGGRGGDIVFTATARVKSLAALRSRKLLRAGHGENGEPANRTGASGNSLEIEVPVGTVIYRAETGGEGEATAAGRDTTSRVVGGGVLADLVTDGERCVVARGGKGGRGNSVFASPTNRSPKYRELGEKGIKVPIRLEIRLMADVGLVGLPNAGKSTLLSVLSAARPKIADYPFTTIAPMLGVVERADTAFTMADLPGLIRGAHLGKGLGIQFLRHIERTRVILHLVDATSEDPHDEFAVIREELEAYGHGLAEKRSIVVLTKADALPPGVEPALPDAVLISAHSGLGLDPLCRAIARLLEEIPEVPPLRTSITMDEAELPVRVRLDEDGVFVVEGAAVQRYLERRSPDDYHGWRRFWHLLERWGVADELKRLGVKNRDTVRIGDYELEYLGEAD
jgi:GTP-binding protein